MASWIITVTEEHIFCVGNFQDFNENFPLKQCQQVIVIPACFHWQVPTGCCCREDKTFPPELTLLFFSKCFPVLLPKRSPPTHWGQPLLQGSTAALLGVWQDGTSFDIYESLWAEMIYCVENVLVCYSSTVNGWEIPGLLMLAEAWEKIWFCHWPLNYSLGNFFLRGVFCCCFVCLFWICLKHVTKNAHPWYILTDNSLCWYKSLANFVIRRNGNLRGLFQIFRCLPQCCRKKRRWENNYHLFKLKNELENSCFVVCMCRQLPGLFWRGQVCGEQAPPSSLRGCVGSEGAGACGFGPQCLPTALPGQELPSDLSLPTTHQRALRVLGRLCHSWFGTWRMILEVANPRLGAALGEIMCSLLCTRDVPQLEEGEGQAALPHIAIFMPQVSPALCTSVSRRGFPSADKWPSWIWY